MDTPASGLILKSAAILAAVAVEAAVSLVMLFVSQAK